MKNHSRLDSWVNFKPGSVSLSFNSLDEMQYI